MTEIALPAGWAHAPLSELLLGIESGKSFKCEERQPADDEVGVVKVSAVTWGEYREAESKTCTEAGRVNPALFVRSGDFLFSRANTVDLVGACVIAGKVTQRIMLSDKILRLQFSDDRLKPWLLQFLRSHGGRAQIEELSTGNQESMRNIGQERIGQIQVPVPPETERERIVEKLEELLSDLDAGVAELKAAQRKLAQYRQSLLKAAVEGALTADWRAARYSYAHAYAASCPRTRASTGSVYSDVRDAGSRRQDLETGAALLQRILAERRARWEQKQLAKFAEQGKTPPKGWQSKYVEPTAPSANGAPTIPPAWVWTGIEQLADGSPHALKAGPFGSALKKEFYTPTGYKVYGQEQVIRGDAHFGDYFISTDKYEELISCAVRPGDLLISLVGTTGRILVLPEDAKPGIINPRLLKVTVSNGNVLPAFLKLVLESPYVRHFFKLNAHGGTMDVLNLGILKELPIPLPELMEQEEIVRRVDEACESIDRQASALDHGLRQCAAQRKNLLKAAFAGQLVPQDPTDEPASALLARIRAMRVAQNATGSGRIGRTCKETDHA